VLTSFSATAATPLPLNTHSDANLHAFPSPGAGTRLDGTESFAGATTVVLDDALPAGTRGLMWRTDIRCMSDRPGGSGRRAIADCAAPACCYSMTVAKSRLILEESLAPALTAVGGTLLAPVAHNGRRTVTFNVADADSGVAEVTVKIGGTVAGSVSYPCPGDDWSVCPRARSEQTIEVDAALVGDTPQPVTITARDAAGNLATVATTAAVAPASPGATATSDPTGGKIGPNGDGATMAARITAAFKGTKKRTRTLSFASRPTVNGTLRRTAGGAIGGATIAILERQRKAGGTWKQIGIAETGADGSFTYRVPGGPSRALSFEYTANSADIKPATTSRLYTKVRVSLSAGGSRRSVRVGAPFVISGRLKFLPRRGVLVTIQGYNRRRWQPVGNVKTDADGRFRWTYRFSAAGAFKTFGFRVRVDSPIYPFAAGNSRRILVSVRR
jgi:hypothetical protein